MDNIIAVVKIIAGRVHGHDRLLLVAAISRRELMRHITLYCRLLRIFVPNPPLLPPPRHVEYIPPLMRPRLRYCPVTRFPGTTPVLA